MATTSRKTARKPAKAGKAHLTIFREQWHVLEVTKYVAGRALCVGLTVERQQRSKWCWAAVANSVSHFYDPSSTWSQCKIVDAELGQATCCTDGASAACNKTWYLDRALTRVGCLGAKTIGPLTFAEVQAQLGAGHPPCARQGWGGGSGHFVAIVCWFDGTPLSEITAAGAAQRIKISDPWYGDSVVDYASFVAGHHGAGAWTHSYTTMP